MSTLISISLTPWLEAGRGAGRVQCRKKPVTGLRPPRLHQEQAMRRFPQLRQKALTSRQSWTQRLRYGRLTGAVAGSGKVWSSTGSMLPST